MGISFSKLERPQLSADRHVDTMKSDMMSTSLSQEIASWEETYRERFSRMLMFSWGTRAPLWTVLDKPVIMPHPWKFGPPSRYPRYQTTPRYAGPTPEPISAELAARTRHELVRSYHNKIMFGSIMPHIRQTWSPSHPLGLVHAPYLNRGDALPPGLLDEDNLIHPEWLNQTTAVYFESNFMTGRFVGECWAEGDELDRYWGHGCAYIARALVAAWLDVHHHDGEIPNFQQMRSFAKPFLLEGQPGHRSATEATIHTHEVFCEEIQKAENRPVSSKDPYTWVDHGCEMGPIYRSVIIIVDEQPGMQRSRNPAEQRDILFEKCSVLLVRTGDEDHLSAPIDFSALVTAGLDLPLGRSEAALVDSNMRQKVIRVRIRTAVRFIMDLERRERNASPRLTAMKNVLDADTSREADEWASAVFAHAEKNGGIDQDEDAWPAVRLARAHLDGDRCGLEDPPFEDRHALRSWWY